MHQALSTLGKPPAVSSDYVSAVTKQSPAGWGVLLNNEIGDCVPADSGHQLMLRTANAGNIVIPTDDDILALYEAVGGYVPGDPNTDQGCAEEAMCQYLVTNGLCGHKLSATAPIDPTNLDHIRWAVQLFGACRMGIFVDERMEDQFSDHQAWDQAADPNDPNAGGHDVPVVKFDSEYAYVVTWGALQPVTWSLMASSAFLEEAHGEISKDWIRAGGTAPSGFDLEALLADLQGLAEQQTARLAA